MTHKFNKCLRSSVGSLTLLAALTGLMAACSSDTPTVTQVPSTISAQAPEPTPASTASAPNSVSFYYDGNKTTVTLKDAAILFAATFLETSDAGKIVNFVNGTLGITPKITTADVTGLGDPLKPAISDFTGDGRVDIKDAAVLFAVAFTGGEINAKTVNGFVANTLGIKEVNVTQERLNTFFGGPTPTPTPSPTSTPTPSPSPSPELVVSPTSLTISSGSTATLTVSLPKQPAEDVKVTVTPSTGITVNPAELNFTPTNFGGTVTVGSTAAPGTKGKVTLSAPGYADKVVDVAVTQSTSIVVNPTSLEIPTGGTGLGTFTVKLTSAPSSALNVTITPPTGFSVNPSSLSFNSLNFNVNQTVKVTATAAAGTEGTIKVFNSTLGQADVKVKALPAVSGQFFIDPVNGNDNNPGTAAQPFKTLEAVLRSGASTAADDIVKVAAETTGTGTGGGTDVTVTILGSATEVQGGATDVQTYSLTRGSVTVVGNPNFTFGLNGYQLELNKGYKLTNFTIVSGSPSSGPAVELNASGTPLAGMTIDCTGFSALNLACVSNSVLAASGGVVTLDTVVVKIGGDKNGTIGIENPTGKVTLEVANSKVQSTTTGGSDVKGISAVSGLIVRSTEVDLSTVGSGSNSNPTIGIKIQASGSQVTGSTIKIKTGSGNISAIGVDASGVSGTATVRTTSFTNVGNSDSSNYVVAINGKSKLNSDVDDPSSSGNSFNLKTNDQKAIN